MDINSIKSEFRNYIVQKQIEENPDGNIDYNVSIFRYAAEFKEFLGDKYNILPSAIDINDLDNLELDGNNIVIGDNEEAAVNNENMQALDNEDLANDEFIETDNNAEMPATEDFINEFFTDENVRNFSDLDGNGDLTEDEIRAVLKSISGKDGNINDISIEDLAALYGILYPEAKEETDEIVNNTDLSSDNFISDNIQTSNKSYPAGNVAKNETGNFQANVSQPVQENLKTKTLDDMTYDELVDAQSLAQADYINANNELTDIMNGNNIDLLREKAQVQQLYDTYEEELEKLDEEEAKKLNEFKTSIDLKEQEIDKKDIEITNQEFVVRNTKSEYEQAVQSRESIEGSISELQGSLSGATDEETAQIQAMISALNTQLEAAKAAESAAEKLWHESEEKLNSLKEEKSGLENELTDINNQKAEWETDLAQKYPEIQEYMDKYNEANTQYETDKANAISAAQDTVNELSDYLAEIESHINNYETDDKKSEAISKVLDELGINTYKDDQNGTSADYNKKLANAILKAAKSYVGGNTKSTGYCARGVREALEEAFGVGNYGLFSGDAYEWADYFNSEKDTWANITGDYKSASDLQNLPAGAIVVWSKYNGGQYGHICIADGKGGEYSDFYRSKIITSFADKGGTYQVFIPKE